MQRPRQPPMAHRHHHLDHARDARSRLRVADVRLDRAQPQRTPLRAILAVGAPAAPAPRSDRPASCPCRAPRPRRPRRRRGPRSASAWRITRSWEGPFGAVRPLLAPSWLTALPRTTASTSAPVAPRVGEALQHQHAHALGPAGAVGAVGEGLAAPVAGQTALAAELHEHRRARHHGSPRPPAPASTPRAQRLAGQVQRHQRGRAGGVDRHRRALQPEAVGDATRHDAAVVARESDSPRAERRRF